MDTKLLKEAAEAFRRGELESWFAGLSPRKRRAFLAKFGDALDDVAVVWRAVRAGLLNAVMCLEPGDD